MQIIHVGTSDWDDATARMTCEEEGAFWRVIRIMYRQGGPVRDDDRLPRALRIDTRSWPRLRSAIQRHGVLEWVGGMIVSKRVQKDLAKVAGLRDEASRNGTKGAAKRWGGAVDKSVDDFGLQPELPLGPAEIDQDSPNYPPGWVPDKMRNPLKTNEPSIATPAPTPIIKKEARERACVGDVEKEKGKPAIASLDPLGVTFADGVIAMTEPHREFWRTRFGSDDALDMALIQAAGYVKPNTAPAMIAAMVGSQLALQLRTRLAAPRATGDPPKPRLSPAAEAARAARRRMDEAVASLTIPRATP